MACQLSGWHFGQLRWQKKSPTFSRFGLRFQLKYLFYYFCQSYSACSLGENPLKVKGFFWLSEALISTNYWANNYPQRPGSTHRGFLQQQRCKGFTFHGIANSFFIRKALTLRLNAPINEKTVAKFVFHLLPFKEGIF